MAPMTSQCWEKLHWASLSAPSRKSSCVPDTFTPSPTYSPVGDSVPAAFSTPGIRYKIASTQEELRHAFALLERSYVERGIAGSGQIRMKILNILPTTTTFIALRGDAVVGTVSLIEDSELGLPIEQVHPEDVARVRNRHRKLAEVGALALEKTERRSAISIMLFNMLYRWARNWRRVDDLLIGIHPSARHFYDAVLQFRRIGATRR